MLAICGISQHSTGCPDRSGARLHITYSPHVGALRGPAMFYIFVDTQAIEREAFGFEDSTGLSALANAVTDGHVTVLLTEITDREVKSHIVDRVTKALAAVKKQFVLQVLSVADFAVWRKLEPDAAVKDAVEQWESYKREIAPTMVSIDAVRPSVVMDAFFEQCAPFSPEKRTEFRDAFVIESLKAWAMTEQQQVIVVSGDSDHRRACDGVMLVHAETIVDGLAHTLEDEAMLAAARIELEQQSDVLQEQLQEALSGLPATIHDDFDADIEEIRVSEVKFDVSDFELVEVRGGRALISGPASVRVEVDATVADYDNGSRDEGDWVFLPYNSLTYIDEIDVRMSVRIPFRDAPPTMEQFEEVILDEPRSLELSREDNEVRVRQHWTEDEDPPEVVTLTIPGSAPGAGAVVPPSTPGPNANLSAPGPSGPKPP